VASCEAMWLRKLLVGIFDLELEPTLIHCDNQSCVKLTKNLVFHDRSKHIKIKISLHPEHGSEKSCGAPIHIHRRVDSGHSHQALVKSEV
jgi:hypothetical protein